MATKERKTGMVKKAAKQAVAIGGGEKSGGKGTSKRAETQGADIRRTAKQAVAKKSAVRKAAKKPVAARRKRPLVSIVMPVYNVAKLIDDTIHSVLGQTFQDFELIVVDDHSTDNTLEVVGQFKTDKIRVISCKRNAGAVSATNRGIRAARGKYLAFIDASDMWQPNKLARQIDCMKGEGATLVCASYVYADVKGRPKGKVVRMPAVIDAARSSLMMTSTVMIDVAKVGKSEARMEKEGLKWQRVFDQAGEACGMYEVMAIRGYDPSLSFFEKVRRGVR